LNRNDRYRTGTLVAAAWRALDRAGAISAGVALIPSVWVLRRAPTRVHLRPGGDRPLPETVAN
jgi:hypothetical protein